VASWRAPHVSPPEPEGRLGLRFVFVDRILRLDPGASIEIVKNVAATEDMFDDHFPGFPVLPGALLVETFEQATQLLVAVTHDFTRVARLERVSRAGFRALVRPGDQLTVTCRRRDADAHGAARRWTVAATAAVMTHTVATATLEVGIVDDHDGTAERLRAMHRTLTMDALQLAGLDRR
jgi:3-hydroxyacyl-[acyl-carrier-protein] dehydratase